MAHPFLQFNPENDKDRPCINKFQALWNRRGKIGVPRRLSWSTLQALNQSERLTNMISVPMSRLLNIHRPVYLELTLEFLASYSYDKPRGGANPDFRHNKRIRFRLGGRWHHWTVARLGRKLGIYTEEELDSELFTSVHTFEGEQQRADFWAQIAVGPAYDARKAKATRLRDPLHRVLHQVISYTIVGRMDSSGNCPTPDLIILYSIVNGVHVNLAARLAEFFMNSGGKTANSEIHGGEYVTQLAYAIGIMSDEVVNGLTFVNSGTDVDLRALKFMGLTVDTDNGPRLRGLQGEIWDPLPPQPEEEHEEELEVEDEPFVQPHPEPQQHQDWPPGIPSYPEFYHQFEQMRVNQDYMRQEMHAGFSYLFGGLQSAFPSHFGDPPQFPFGNQGGAGPSGAGHGDDMDE